jgi:hypothetical protein
MSVPPFFQKNFDYGSGFYSNMDKYKSLADFRKKKRKKKMKKRRAFFISLLYKMAENKEKGDNNNLTDATEDVLTPILADPAIPNTIGLLDDIYPKTDLDDKPVSNLYYGRLETHNADDNKENDKKKQ